MSVSALVVLELTPEQLDQLAPLFERAAREHETGRPGIIVAQPWSQSDLTHPKKMRVAFIESERAEIICSVIALRPVKP